MCKGRQAMGESLMDLVSFIMGLIMGGLIAIPYAEMGGLIVIPYADFVKKLMRRIINAVIGEAK